MFRYFYLALVLLIAANAAFAQARRVPAPRSTASASTNGSTDLNAGGDVQTPAALYEDADGYAKRKFEEFQTKKIPYSDQLRRKTLLEQKQLAARYAAQLAGQNLSGEDSYYLGLLYLLSENNDGAAERMKQFLAGENLAAEKMQTARSIVGVAAARKKDFQIAETMLRDYLKTDPVRASERVRVETELAENYFAVKNFERAAFHAEAALSAAKPALSDWTANRRTADDFLDLGFLLVEVYAATGAGEKIEKTLEDLRETGSFAKSPVIYAQATDKLIQFLIETKRKPEAFRKLGETRAVLETKFKDSGARQMVGGFLKRREPQYKLLGEPAAELSVDRWLAGDSASLQNLRGRVVMLDFWAHWCEPCFAMFPRLNELSETYSKQGLTLIGVTRYYGQGGGFKLDNDAELAYLAKIKRQERISYNVAVAKNLANHDRYAVESLPTVVLIDKKGTIRYLETGVNGFDTEAVEKLIQRLLAE